MFGYRLRLSSEQTCRALSLIGLTVLASLIAPVAFAATVDKPPAVMLLASTEWRPYTGMHLKQGGLSALIVDTAARKFGYKTKINFFPWNRAVQVGHKDARYAGYFPAYHTEERAGQCYFSASLGTSVLTLAYRKSKPLHWQSLSDLAGLRIGIVAGYSNGADFDAMAKQGKLTADPSPNDLANMRKLLADRVDAIVIDRLVMRYLMLNDPTLREHIALHEQPLAELTMHVCFQRTPEGLRLRQAFNTALKSVPIRKLEVDYFQQLSHGMHAADSWQPASTPER